MITSQRYNSNLMDLSLFFKSSVMTISLSFVMFFTAKLREMDSNLTLIEKIRINKIPMCLEYSSNNKNTKITHTTGSLISNVSFCTN